MSAQRHAPAIAPPPANMIRHLRDDHGVDKSRLRPEWDRQHARLHAAGDADHYHRAAGAQ